MSLIAWKTVQPLCPEARHEPRVHLTVAVEGVQAGTPAPLVPRVLFVLEEDQARLLGVDLEVFPEGPVRVKMSLELI